MPARTTFLLRACSILFATVAEAGASSSPSLAEGAADLARKIAAGSARGRSVRISVRNLSSLSSVELVAAREAIETQLRASGFALDESSPTELRLTFSENLQGYLWVADVSEGDSRRVSMVAVDRPESRGSTPRFAIVSERLWEQAEPILDVAWRGDRLFLLTPSELIESENREGRILRRERIPKPPRGAWPRDLRGRVEVVGDAYRVYLPGVLCAVTSGRGLSSGCRPSEEPWPLSMKGNRAAQLVPAAGRNFFLSLRTATASGSSLFDVPFFSAARVEEESGREVWIAAGIDGRVRIYRGSSKPVATWAGWGSDLAAVKSACGSGWQVLVSRAVDFENSDAVQAYEIQGDQAVPVSSPLDLGGAVMALSPRDDGRSASAVVRKPGSGRHEAYRLTLDCTR